MGAEADVDWTLVLVDARRVCDASDAVVGFVWTGDDR